MIKRYHIKNYIAWIAVLVLLIKLTISIPQVQAQSAVVNAILFYSPSCPHCQTVIQEHLPPLLEKYGSQLYIVGINVSIQQGQDLYQSAVNRFQIPEDKLGVPSLIVGDTVLVGSVEIPEQFPGIIENGLAHGGISMPDIPGLQEALAESREASPNDAGRGASQNSDQSYPESQVGVEISNGETNVGTGGGPNHNSTVDLSGERLSVVDRFKSDLSGNILSLFVLLGMIGSIISVGVNFSSSRKSHLGSWPEWAVPLLAAIGMGISLYMSYVEITQIEAICGPVGNCNAVQQSTYARLFGVLPVGVLGVVGYMLIGITWLLQKLGPEKWRKGLALILWGMALAGVFFSIYLTFLEPFVIGATCAWCIASAIVITLIFLAASEPARLAWKGNSN
jgi:uncharacterized membrane protein